MKKNDPVSLEQFDFSDRIADHPAVQWIYENGRMIGYICLGLIVLSILAYKFSNHRQYQSEHDYIEAENTWSSLAEAPLNEEQTKPTLLKMQQLVNHHSDLAVKYDSLLAQLYLYEGNTKDAFPLAKRSLARTAEELKPFYYSYATTSLLIAEKNYSQALTEAQSLDHQMNEQLQNAEKGKEFGNVLYFFNLLRIATLQKELQLPKDELQTLNKIEAVYSQMFTWELADQQAIQNAFNEDKVNLKDYLDYRKKALS